jgi:hypothetical protein
MKIAQERAQERLSRLDSRQVPGSSGAGVSVTTCVGFTQMDSSVSASLSQASVPGLLRAAFCSGFSTSLTVPATFSRSPVLSRSVVEGCAPIAESFH